MFDPDQERTPSVASRVDKQDFLIQICSAMFIRPAKIQNSESHENDSDKNEG